MSTPEPVLRDIMRRDPDGWETRQPTHRDYNAFTLWVVDTYGQGAWTDYMNWGTRP